MPQRISRSKVLSPLKTNEPPNDGLGRVSQANLPEKTTPTFFTIRVLRVETYADRTNQVYIGLFGMRADAMKQQWDLMRGDAKIARNYISEEKGLEAVKFCEGYGHSSLHG